MAPWSRAQPLVVILGETGSGKSALALELAKKLDGEIVTADSWTVYKNFDIGTAKPTKSDQNAIKHHLLDIAEPQAGFNAAEFKQRANKAISDIIARGKLPILVGGTGLYIDSVVFNYSFLPAGPTKQRAALNQKSLTELQQAVERANLTTTGIDLRNKRRLIRLLETAGQRPNQGELRKDTLMIGLRLPKDQLERRIELRVTDMFAKGLEQEVKFLSAQYGWDAEPLKGIGYKEFKAYFAGQQTLPETKKRIISSTLQLAKKQRTWFRRNKSIHWLDSPINLSDVVDLVTTHLNK